MVLRSDIQQQAGEIARAKAAAKECLIAADKYLKDRLFDKARQQVDKAKAIDPSNPYISAFEERIKIFEEQIKAQAQRAEPAPAPSPAPPPLPSPKAVTPAIPRFVPDPEPVKPAAKPAPEQPRAAPVPKVSAPEPSSVVPIPTKPAPSAAQAPDELKNKMDEMSRQILELSQALLAERRTREDILKKQMEQSVRQYREALRKVWALGAPKEKQQEDLAALARSLTLDDEMVSSVTREIKLEMYGKAVKDVLAKRKLIRSSSSTMEWLRKVYQVSMAEYLEYESKFLLDLVSDQFRGTMLMVSGTDDVRREVGQRMKSSGFAVVVALTPEEALEKIERVNPTIVLTEAQFPGRVVSGIMFLQLLRANPKFSYVPVLLLCEEQEMVSLQSSELRPIEGVIKLPVDFDELNAVINEKLAVLRNTISSL